MSSSLDKLKALTSKLEDKLAEKKAADLSVKETVSPAPQTETKTEAVSAQPPRQKTDTVAPVLKKESSESI